MYFQQFYLACLSHASYMIGSGDEAAVVDPQRDVGIYVEEARKNGLRIAHVIETHLHADFVSGHMELAALTGAKIYVGAAAGAQFPHVAVRDGDEIRFGACRLGFLETPGHTVESVSVTVTDVERSVEPFAVLTGDTLFIGDVGRPDLAPDRTPQELAGMLYDSLRKLVRLGDGVEVYPAHGAGSLCGRGMSSERSSTIGKERAGNYALRAAGREEFVKMLTSDLPERPGYFALDAELNRAGARPLVELKPPAALLAAEVEARRREGAVVLDTRAPVEFGAAHVAGALHIGLGGQFALWAGTLLGLDARIVVVAEDAAKVTEAQTRLARVGIERVEGFLDGGMPAWVAAGMPAAQVSQINVEELARRREEFVIVDVRRAPEWHAGHIEGAVHMPLDRLRPGMASLDRARPVAVHCAGGYRSSIAASLLEAAGFGEVANVMGGFDAWKACGLAWVDAGQSPAAA